LTNVVSGIYFDGLSGRFMVACGGRKEASK
jgi:hypothetical protein